MKYISHTKKVLGFFFSINIFTYLLTELSTWSKLPESKFKKCACSHNITSPNIAQCAMSGKQYERQAKPALLLAKLVVEVPLTYVVHYFFSFSRI